MREPRRSSDAASDDRQIRVGVSSCLLGERVRYDGKHKHDRYLTDVLGSYLSFVAVCPEVEIGMGTPREPVGLLREGKSIRMVGVTSGDDHTERMRRYARRRVAALAALGLSGYVLKGGSPSCGMARVPIHEGGGVAGTAARGLFADELMRALPLLPVEEEGRLADTALRENFIVRVFAYRRVEDFFSGHWTTRGLAAFHARERMLVRAHAPAAEKELAGVACSTTAARGQVRQGYRTLFMTALARAATPGRHSSVLRQILGLLRGVLEPRPRRHLEATINDYRKALVPLVVPLALLRHYAELYSVDSVACQTYLEPDPRELMLRSRA